MNAEDRRKLIHYNKHIAKELAENGGKLYDLPPDHALSTSQDHKKS